MSADDIAEPTQIAVDPLHTRIDPEPLHTRIDPALLDEEP